MVKHLDGYLLKLVYHKVLSLGTFFLININEKSDNIASIVKLFTDDTSIFYVVNDANISEEGLHKDLQKTTEWTYKWKISFNPDLNKQVQEVIFSRKLHKSTHSKIYFSNARVFGNSGFRNELDESLNFSYHVMKKMSKAMKGMGIIKKLNKTLPQQQCIHHFRDLILTMVI